MYIHVPVHSEHVQVPCGNIFHSPQQEARGLKNPEAVKAKQKRREEAEKMAKAAGGTSDSALKVGF